MMPLLEKFRGRRSMPAPFRVPGWLDLRGQAFPYGYVFISLLALAVGYLNVLDPRLSWIILLEDHLLENLTVAFYLLAALALLTAAARPQRWFPPRALYLLAAAGCLFFAGEELSWGQRLFGFATPDFFAGFNAQSESNFHNFDRDSPAFIQFLAHRRRLLSGWLLLCLAVAVAYFHGRDQLLGVPLPSMPLLFGFLLTLVYLHREEIGFIVNSGVHTLLLLLLLYAWFAKQGQLLFLAVVALVNIEASLYINNNLLTITPRKVAEPFEFLAAAGFLAYSLELLWHAGRPRRGEAPAAAALPRGGPGLADGAGAPAGGWAAGWPRPAWLLAGAFIIAASLSLVALESIKARLETAPAAAAWQWVADGAAGEPFAQSDGGLEVYWNNGQVVYVGRERPCAELERRPGVFLHLTPSNPDDLPETGRRLGYENLGFSLERRRQYQGADGSCVVAVPLPGYPISQIHTGQSGVSVLPWEGRLVVDFTAYQAAYEAATTAPPVLRSTFDVYLDGRAVTYIKEPCAAADTAGMFILHPYPVNPSDLPEGRQEHGFDNLDFQFHRHGARFGGKCVAAAPLPDYPIDRLRVGQWLPDENRQLWQGEIPVGR